MKVRVLRPGELGAGERHAWRDCQRADPSLRIPFLSYEFAAAVDRARDDARVALVEDVGDAAAFLAFTSVEPGIGAPVGATICDAQALVARGSFGWDARELIRAAGLSVWTFDHLVCTQRPFVPFHRARHRSPIVDLIGGLDRYRADVRARSKDVLAQVARRRRKLGREVGPVTFEWHTTDPRALETLLGWKSAQYRETGVWDRFGERWIVDVVRVLAATNSEHLTGVVSTLRAGDGLVAVHLGLAGCDRLTWWFPAYAPAFGRYSPGLVLLLDLIADAAVRGIDVVDLGRGEHHYKLRVANATYEVAEGAVRVDE